MEALHSLSCRAGCASRVSLLSVPRRGWLISVLGQQGLSLLRQGPVIFTVNFVSLVIPPGGLIRMHMT